MRKRTTQTKIKKNAARIKKMIDARFANEVKLRTLKDDEQ
jgi:hypothetical protein